MVDVGREEIGGGNGKPGWAFLHFANSPTGLIRGFFPVHSGCWVAYLRKQAAAIPLGLSPPQHHNGIQPKPSVPQSAVEAVRGKLDTAYYLPRD